MWFNGWTILSWLEHTSHKRYYLVYHTNEAVDAVSVLYFFDVLELSLQTHQQATIRHIDQTTHYCHPPHLHFTIIFVLIFENFSVHAIIIIVQQSVLKDKNSELHETKRAKGRNESRITYLENMIKTAKIVEHSTRSDIVGLGNTVTVRLDGGKEMTYQIVTTISQDAQNGKVSVKSPFAQAIFGKKVGDRAKVVVSPEFSYFVEIVNIKA